VFVNLVYCSVAPQNPAGELAVTDAALHSVTVLQYDYMQIASRTIPESMPCNQLARKFRPS
jgi:hypothetical protein